MLPVLAIEAAQIAAAGTDGQRLGAGPKVAERDLLDRVHPQNAWVIEGAGIEPARYVGPRAAKARFAVLECTVQWADEALNTLSRERTVEIDLAAPLSGPIGAGALGAQASESATCARAEPAHRGQKFASVKIVHPVVLISTALVERRTLSRSPAPWDLGSDPPFLSPRPRPIVRDEP